ncbi:MAG: sigma-70 family RNA polymerase sigma factor, partial [Clostridia bacterium]|nr:sigma-70 family RNA polymerase sigma factor [Clostridia bacterium]
YDPVYQDASDAIYVMDQVRDNTVSENDWVRTLSINQALARLNDRERRIISRRYFSGRTQMEVASEIGISQAQVSRLEKSALQQMKRYIK